MDCICPHCREPLEIHPRRAGEVVACPDCGGRFRAPLPEAGDGHPPRMHPVERLLRGWMFWFLLLAFLVGSIFFVHWLSDRLSR